jgi:hypothetical protein
VLAIPDAELDTTQCVDSLCEGHWGAGVPGIEFGVFRDRRWVVDWVEVTH